MEVNEVDFLRDWKTRYPMMEQNGVKSLQEMAEERKAAERRKRKYLKRKAKAKARDVEEPDNGDEKRRKEGSESILGGGTDERKQK